MGCYTSERGCLQKTIDSVVDPATAYSKVSFTRNSIDSVAFYSKREYIL